MNIKLHYISLGLLSFSIGTANASGFRVPETSVAGIGASNALVADYGELGSLPYNPANMSFIDGRNLVFGAALIKDDIHVDPENGTSTDSTGESTFLIPHYYYMSTVDKNWSYGLNINVPFGLETKWPDETFATFPDANPLLDGLEPEMSRIAMLNFNPNVSYRFGDTSAAVGLNYYDIRELVFNTQAIQITGEGGDIGWNIALQHVAGPMSFGMSYRSAVEIELNGRLKESIVGSSSNASATLELPSILQIGAHLIVNRDWSVEFDIDRTGWSSFDEINIKHSNAVLIGATGKNTITSTNNWVDTNAYRLGAKLRIDPKGHMRFGYSYDNRAQEDDYFSPRIPDSDRQLFSVGYARQMKTWSFDLGYMYVKVDDRNVNSSTSYLAQAAGGNTEANGTDAYNGTYQSDVHILGIGFKMEL